jgi:sugar phosphate isomerase/epimerase
MDIKVFCPLWGHEQEDIVAFVRRVKEAGYDGLECPLPGELAAKRQLLDALDDNELLFISQLVWASGDDFSTYKESYSHFLKQSLDGNPVLINCHTGRDYFSLEENLKLIDLAQEFEAKTGKKLAHETHRRMFSYAPAVTHPYFDAREDLAITADFSHWVCVSEGFLDNFAPTMDLAIGRAMHIHARVGYHEGPQVPDPRAPEWNEAVDRHLHWWKRIAQTRAQAGAAILTVTPEFGPAPYMPTIPFSNKPVADQFEVNRYMMDLVRRELAQ